MGWGKLFQSPQRHDFNYSVLKLSAGACPKEIHLRKDELRRLSQYQKHKKWS